MTVASRIPRRSLLGGLAASAGATLLGAPAARATGFDWTRLPLGQWMPIPTTGSPPRKAFHGTMVVDPDRDLLFVLGADTHYEDYDNSVYRLDLVTLRWSRDYSPDPVDDYRVTPDGYTLTEAGRPWAMHTFDTVDYDPVSRAILMVAFPAHEYLAHERLKVDPGRLARPVWYYHPDQRGWELRKLADTPQLFAKAMAWHAAREEMIATTSYDTWHLDPRRNRWRRQDVRGPYGWHLKMVYDPTASRVLSYGANGGSDVLWAYDADRVSWSRIATDRQAPPGEGAALAFAPNTDRMLYLAPIGPSQYANPSGNSEAWVFHGGAASWHRLAGPVPPVFGINYHINHEPRRGLVLYGERDPKGLLALWAFRYAE